MQVLVYDPMVTSNRIEKAGYKSVSLTELYQQADYITIHVPKLKSTEGLLNEEAFNSMKDGVMIINCARGGIVDEKALYHAMVSGKVAGAALDVFETEPPGQTDFIGLKQLISTPHLGASTLEAQTNVAVAVSNQIIKYLKEGTILNAVNAPSVTGELLEKLKPFLFLADGIGTLQSQFCKAPVKEIIIEYAGNFKGLDLEPVTIAVVKGVLSKLYREEVNSVNAPIIAKDMGIGITVKKSGDISDYNNLMTINVVTEKEENIIVGTIFGKNEPRVVKINKFRLELIPKKGNFALIHNIDKPGAIGSIGIVLGENNINIARMVVGQEDDGERNIIFIRTDTPIPEDVLEKLTALPLIKSVKPLEL
jgi:D-3-phosphoglycerate dehydrogenase